MPSNHELSEKEMLETMTADQQKQYIEAKRKLIADLTQPVTAQEAKKRILVLDFDGVIHSYTSGWKGADVIPDAPVPGAFDFIKEAIDAEYEVNVFSSRSHQSGGIHAMQQWFFDHDLPYAYLIQIQFPRDKPAAYLTIDDRAMMFTGEWPSMETIDNFKPWYKRGA